MKRLILMILLVVIAFNPVFAKKKKVNWGKVFNDVNCKYRAIAEKYSKKAIFTYKKGGKIKKGRVPVELILGVMTQESLDIDKSVLNPRALSHAKARGLMQILPKTCKLLGCDYSKLDNPEYNIKYGTKYLKGLLKYWNGNLDKTLSSYNGGPASTKYKGDSTGVYKKKETQNYVKRVKYFYKKYKKHRACSTGKKLPETNYALDKKIIAAAETETITSEEVTVYKGVPEAIDTEGERNFYYSLKNENTHLNFSIPVKPGAALLIKFPRVIEIVEMINGNENLITAEKKLNIIKIAVNDKGYGKKLYNERSNLQVQLDCGISIEFIFTVVNDKNTTLLSFDYPEYEEEIKEKIEEKLQMDEEEKAKAEEKAKEERRKKKAEKAALKQYENHVKLFAGFGFILPASHRDIGSTWNVPVEILFKMSPEIDAGLFFNMNFSDNLELDTYYGKIRGTEFYNYKLFNILAETRYNIENTTIFQPHLLMAAGISIESISQREFYMESGTQIDYPEKDFMEAGFSLNAGLGVDMDVWRGLLLKFDGIYNFTSAGNHVFMLNLSLGYEINFSSKKEEKIKEEEEEEEEEKEEVEEEEETT